MRSSGDIGLSGRLKLLRKVEILGLAGEGRWELEVSKDWLMV